MMNTTFFKKLTVVLVALFFASCDKDYTTLGADIVGNENFEFGPGKSFGVKAYNQKVPTVQTNNFNNLPLNQLGTYDDEIFGTTTAGFVTQLSLATVKPTFTSNVVIDSVLLTVPYFSTKTSTDANGKGTYRLESMQGSGTINLEVYRNGVILRDYDLNTDFLTAQKYFSNEENTGENFYGNRVLATDGKLNNFNATFPQPNENTTFEPDNKEYIRFKPTENLTPGAEVLTNIESRNSPRMTLHLDKVYFQNEILDKANNPATEMHFADNGLFKKYFKGLYFRVVSGTSRGRMMNLDFSKGDVTVYYKQDKIAGNSAVKEMKNLVMKMTGNTVNLFNNVDDPTYSNAVNNPDKINGDKTIYLKGGVGSTAYIELFSGTELQELRNSNILVNDASLTFTVDDPIAMTADYKRPLRIYIFDADNNTTILDYYYDETTDVSDSRLNKTVYGGIIQEVKVDGVTKYKYRVRITQHINNIIKNTAAKNLRLGVVVTENINVPNMVDLETPILDPDPLVPGSERKFSRFPVASIKNPLGIRLFGTHPDVPAADRMKFEIFYTKPN